MKSLKKGILILLVILLCGCTSVSTNMSITKDKGMTLSYILALSKDYTGNKTFKYIFDSSTINDLKNNGYSVSDYEDDNYYGYKISVTVNSIDAISDTTDKNINIFDMLNNDVQNELYIFKLEEGLLKNKYTANFIVDMSNMMSKFSDELSGISAIPQISYKFVLELPEAAISSNATSVSADKKTLTWNYSNIYNTSNKINFTFSLYNKQMLWMIYIFIGVVILIIINIIVRIIIAIEDFFKRLKRKRYERAQKRMEKKLLKKQRKEQDKLMKEQLKDTPMKKDTLNEKIFTNGNPSMNNNMMNNQSINNQGMVQNNNMSNQNIGDNQQKSSLYVKRNILADFKNNMVSKVKGIFKKKDKNLKENNNDDKNVM